MEDQIVECLPNFSEARRPEVIDQIISEIQAVKHVTLLNRHSDLDHNRTILTFIGHPQAVEEAAFRSIQKAAELIDLNMHTGNHPRIGAADVVPFVPLQNIDMDACVAISRRVAERVGSELKLPVYLYDQSATRPDRQNLDDLRQGEYETLKTAILIEPRRAPDFGPSVLGPAGAVIIGARNHLVSMNIFLSTSNLNLAVRIARCIRHNSGGLRYVQAAGVPLEGKAVVSVTVTDFHKTKLSRLFEMIEMEASQIGTSIEYTRIVGLIPRQALLETAAWKLKLDQFKPDQILETHMEQACQELLDHDPQANFLDQLASTTPTPAGGSAAAYTAAQAAALVGMVARITLVKKKYADVHDLMNDTAEKARNWQTRLSEYVQVDARAYEEIIHAARLPQQTPAEKEYRQQQMTQAFFKAAEIPLECARITIQVMESSVSMAEIGNINTIGDAAAAAAMAQAAIIVFSNNIRLNLKAYHQQARAEQMIALADEFRAKAEQYSVQVQDILRTRGGI